MQADEPPVLDRAAFDDFAGLFQAGELRDMLDEWRADCDAALARIEEALRRDDRADAGSAAHRMAGGAFALGAIALARSCERLRSAAESGGAVGEDDVARLRAGVDAALAAMAASAGGGER